MVDLVVAETCRLMLENRIVTLSETQDGGNPVLPFLKVDSLQQEERFSNQRLNTGIFTNFLVFLFCMAPIGI